MKKFFLIFLLLVFSLVEMTNAQTLFRKGVDMPVGTLKLGSTAVTVTAGQLNSVVNKVNIADSVIGYTAAEIDSLCFTKAETDSAARNLTSTTVQEMAGLGSENLTYGTWTSTDWTGDWATGWTHTAGNTSPLSHSATVINGNIHYITFTVTGGTTGTFTVSVGGAVSAAISATGAVELVLQATSTAGLVITPTSTFDKTIQSLSVKYIGTVAPTSFKINDSGGTSSFEVRNSLAADYNTMVGKEAGGFHIVGSHNTFFGYRAGYRDSYGYQNTILGSLAGQSVVTAYSNVLVGYRAGYGLKTGNTNVLIGNESGNSIVTATSNTFAGHRAGYVSTGESNTFVGAFAASATTSGGNNQAIGVSALGSNTTGQNNFAVGYRAGNSLADGTTANQTPSYSLFIGNNTRANAAGGQNEIVIGDAAIGNGSNSITLGKAASTHIFIPETIVLQGFASAPANAGSAGVAGTIVITATHIYVCSATNTWVRAALATW